MTGDQEDLFTLRLPSEKPALNWTPNWRHPKPVSKAVAAWRPGEKADERLHRILLAAGCVVEGHPDWKTPEEVAAWVERERRMFPGVAAYVEAKTPGSACKFIRMCEG